MYFTIKRTYLKNGEYLEVDLKSINDIINEFPEIHKINDHAPNAYWYDYYSIDIKSIRKIKLQSLQDKNIKVKLMKLQTLLYNENFITLRETAPNFSEESGSTGTSGFDPLTFSKVKKSYFKTLTELKKIFEN